MNFKHLFLVVLSIFLAACNKADDIGEELLNSEKLDFFYDSSLPLKVKNIESERLFSFIYTKKLDKINAVSPEVAIIGEMNDIAFGKVKSNFYTRIIYNSNSNIPKFTNFTFDSAVLVMAYDTLGFFGPRNAYQHIILEEIDEDFDNFDTIFADQKLKVKSYIIGEKMFFPNLKDSITITDRKDGTKIKLPPQIRIRMDDTWAQNFIFNPEIKDGPKGNADETLYKIFKGIKFSSTSNGKSLLGMNVGSAILPQGICRLTFYMKNENNEDATYSFLLSNLKFNSFEIDKSTGAINEFFGNTSKSDSLVFLQSLNGPAIEIDLSSIDKYKDKNIIDAVLELNVANPFEEIEKEYPYITQILANKLVDGKLKPIQDIQDILDRSNNFPPTFGFDGTLKKDKQGNYSYNMVLTKQIKEFLKNPKMERKIIIQAATRGTRATRTIFYGPKNSKKPMKLKLTFA